MIPVVAVAFIAVLIAVPVALWEWRANVRYERDANARIANVRRQIDALPPLPEDWRVP